MESLPGESLPIESTFGRFFLPGPTEVHPEVLSAQSRAVIGHRGPAVKELMGELQTGLTQLFCTESPVLISTSSATGLMEAAVRNGARSRVLSLVNGAFSQRFGEIAEACGFEVETLEVEWGQAITADQARDKLASGGFDAVTVVHSETSTGALNPIEEISEVVREQDDVVLLVDSVTGVGGAEVRTDAWALDFVLTGSQKALALPPGLSFLRGLRTPHGPFRRCYAEGGLLRSGIVPEAARQSPDAKHTRDYTFLRGGQAVGPDTAGGTGGSMGPAPGDG